MGLQYLVEYPRQPKQKVNSNYISTTKYNLLTFLPLALIIQFKRYANIYFLICAILQSIPQISPLAPFSAIAPLVFVLTLSLIRQGFQDYKRWKSDERDNSQIAQYYHDHQFTQIKWKDIKKGDIIKLQKDQQIPTDCFILLCSNSSGISYVQTSSLDGQKNLKLKFSSASLQKYYNRDSKIPDFTEMRSKINCIDPSAEIQIFEGELQLQYKQVEIKERINKKNMVLRGCKLKNTDWAIGMVVYVGKDTAIMMNGSQPFTKISNIERKVNIIILYILAFQILCCIGSAGFCYYGCTKQFAFQNYIQSSNQKKCIVLAVISFFSYFILYSTFIPISLIVSLEFVKVFQGYFMSIDQEMYCAINQRALECRTVSINEQLGQIDYILTDKTGTLTCNKMEFKNIVIGHQIYGQKFTLANFEEGINYQRLSSRFSQENVIFKQKMFDSRSLTYDLVANEPQKSVKHFSKKNLIQLMFYMITTCHECVPSQKGGFEGPSPDEVSLLNAAYKIGFKFLSCENKIIKIQYNKVIKTYQLLKLIQFDSDRKRMTVVLKSQEGISVFVKGADTIIEKLLSANQRYLNDIKRNTDQMSRTGLRSLWFAYKTLPSNSDIKNIKAQELESQLTLIGATGIQDKLQDFVAQTIFSLRSGGIKFIMLTGDKLQTAQNIALSCRLIEQGFLIRSKNDLQKFVEYMDAAQIRNTQITKSPVIDGSTLSFSENQINLQIAIEKVKSVVFCRVTPGQKAEIVRLVKSMGKLTLAIGDGANDVNMIMEAHVGIGIFGQQGTRAAQVANYAIGQFCLLWKLLLYYGRLNYMRITEMILYFFYKNMVFTSVQLAYCFYNLGSGQSFWLSWSITFYNMVFTFFPVVLRAVFEIDIQVAPTKQTFHQLSLGTHQKQTLYSYYPKMYYISQKNKLFTNKQFLSWFSLGIIQGVICLILTLYSIGDQNDTSGVNSYQIGFYLVQISAYTSVIIVVTIKLAVNVKHWTVILFLGFLIPSLGSYIGYTFIMQIFEYSVSYKSMIDLLSMPIFYIIQFMCIGGMFCFDFFLFSLQALKDNFQNYLKFKTLKLQRLSQSNLNEKMLQMVESDRASEYK